MGGFPDPRAVRMMTDSLALREVLSALEAPVSKMPSWAPWQPIERAPRDGTRLLLFKGDDPHAYMAHHNLLGHLYVVGCWDIEARSWAACEAPYARLDPTDWMLLPGPPR